MILTIEKFGAEILSTVAGDALVEDIELVRTTVAAMLHTMTDAGGIGLAAPQVGIPKRIIVMKLHGKQYAIVNPEIVKRSANTALCREGCLSVPGFFTNMRRHKQVTVTGVDPNFNPVKYKFRGLLAACVQHEIDHLNGVTIKG